MTHYYAEWAVILIISGMLYCTSWTTLNTVFSLNRLEQQQQETKCTFRCLFMITVLLTAQPFFCHYTFVPPLLELKRNPQRSSASH